MLEKKLNSIVRTLTEVIGQTENRYSGIPTIKRAIEEAGLQSPKFESTYGVFRVTLYNAIAKKEEPLTPFQQSILDFCTRPRTRGELEERFKDDITIAYLMTKHIFPMVKAQEQEPAIRDGETLIGCNPFDNNSKSIRRDRRLIRRF